MPRHSYWRKWKHTINTYIDLPHPCGPIRTKSSRGRRARANRVPERFGSTRASFFRPQQKKAAAQPQPNRASSPEARNRASFPRIHVLGAFWISPSTSFVILHANSRKLRSETSRRADGSQAATDGVSPPLPSRRNVKRSKPSIAWASHPSQPSPSHAGTTRCSERGHKRLLLRTCTLAPPPLTDPPRDRGITPPSDHRSSAAPQRPPPIGKIAYKAGHRARNSLLGGGETAYSPLAGGAYEYPQSTFSQPQAPYAPGGYHDRQGLTTSNTVDLSHQNQSGWSRIMYWPSTLWTWSFFLVALLQAIICLSLEAYVFGKFEASLTGEANQNPYADAAKAGTLTIPTYLTIFIFGFLYQLVLVWDALRLKNTIQVIGICLYNLGMMIYAAVEIDQVDTAIEQLAYAGGINPSSVINQAVWEQLRPFLIAAPCVLALGTVLLSFVAWKLYSEFAWTIYKHISADIRLKRRYLTYQIYIALLKFDFFFFLGFTVQFLVVVGPKTETYEFALTIAALPITVILLFLAAYFTRRESYYGQAFIILLQFVGMAYFIFKLVRMYDSPMEADYAAARHSLTTFAVLTILLLVVTIIAASMCMSNFNKGLAPHIRKRKIPDADDVKYSNYGSDPNYGGGQHQMGPVGSTRMTID